MSEGGIFFVEIIVFGGNDSFWGRVKFFCKGGIDVVGRDMIEFMRKFVKTIAC